MRKPITRAEYNKLVKQVAEALRLASRHDPDHESRLDLVEHRLDRIGAPQYRRV